MEGVILRGIGGFYYVLDDTGTVHTVRAQGKLRRKGTRPKTGDRCLFAPGTGDEDGWILEILPRKNEMARPPVANIDLIAVVLAAKTPNPDLLLADRMMLSAAAAGIPAMLIINKSDLDDERSLAIAEQYAGTGIAVMRVSASAGIGIEALKETLKGKVHAFAGQSGVGKSTLINTLYGLRMATGELSEKIERGKNTTRHCELVPVEDGGMVLDTPGFSLLETPLIDPADLPSYWPEFSGLNAGCFFSPCFHATEPKCAVLGAVAEGKINRERHERYTEVLREMRERWRERYD
ncbi:MAG: ribosome small subunit-dependent GTPase A [Clostridia bacterium]|nr:ribosome small subunit-dependent GTPase A [Clostridia bacterium]